MSSNYKAVKITDSVYWVGAIDWAVRDFHGYSTDKGTTYNAFLVLGDKITLIDTVKAPFKEELLSRIRSIIDINKIDYIISNHSEMDHSGCIPDIIELANPEKIYTSKMGMKGLVEHFPSVKEKIVAVADSERLNIGGKNYTFLEARMLHWPDSMLSYLEEDQILFSNDVFGMHLASSERFDDELPENILEYEAAKYYANIVLPFSSFVTKFYKRFQSLNLPISYIATDHGPIWRKDIAKIVDLYAKWAERKPTNKAVIIYDTMWGSTAKMAGAVCEGLTDAGVKTKILPLGGSHRSEIITELLDAGIFMVGSPVLNNNLFPTLMDVLTYVKGLRPVGLIGGAFGSYGWNGSALDELKDILQNQMKTDFLGDVVKSNYVPDEQKLKECYDYGQQAASKLKEVINESVAL